MRLAGVEPSGKNGYYLYLSLFILLPKQLTGIILGGVFSVTDGQNSKNSLLFCSGKVK